MIQQYFQNEINCNHFKGKNKCIAVYFILKILLTHDIFKMKKLLEISSSKILHYWHVLLGYPNLQLPEQHSQAKLQGVPFARHPRFPVFFTTRYSHCHAVSFL